VKNFRETNLKSHTLWNALNLKDRNIIGVVFTLEGLAELLANG
jgi:hypothetical protein